jgi:uncharacterized peroxidase-related enzyme
MPYIKLENDLPGLLGLLAYRQDTAKPLLELVRTLMEGPSSLSRGERELIGSLVSQASDCRFCTNAHAAFSATCIDGGAEAVREAQADPSAAPVPPRTQALINVALAVKEGGHEVTQDLVDAAFAAGATDREVHDAVLLASTFALFTRYVDGLGTTAPEDPAWYEGMAQQLTHGGYAGMAQMLSQQTSQPANA